MCLSFRVVRLVKRDCSLFVRVFVMNAITACGVFSVPLLSTLVRVERACKMIRRPNVLAHRAAREVVVGCRRRVRSFMLILETGVLW